MNKYLILISVLFFQFVCGCSIFHSYRGPTLNSKIHHESFNWEIDSTEAVTFYYLKGSKDESNIEEIKKKTDGDINKLLQLINEDRYNKRIHFFLVSNKDMMEELIGERLKGGANPYINAVYAIYDSIKVFGIHEFNHIIIHNLWGRPDYEWLTEGFAIYSDDYYEELHLYELSKYYLETEKFIPFSKLSDDFYSFEHKYSYPLAGSFVKYLIENYGMDKFRVLWKKGEDAMLDLFEKSFIDLEKEWLEKIKKCDSNGFEHIIYNF